MVYATADDFKSIYNVSLDEDETNRVTKLIELASSLLRSEAKKRKKDLDEMISGDADLLTVAKIVVCASVQRVLKKSYDNAGSLSGFGDMQQVSQSALGYSVSGTFFNPGDDIYFLNNELKRLGLLKQSISAFEIFDVGGDS